MSKVIQFSVQIDSAKANNDRTLSLKIDTQELSSQDTSEIFGMFQKQLWLALSETEISKEQLNIPEVLDEMDKKSPSQRLRDRMFVYFKSKKAGGNFDEWYKAEMERIGSKYLERVD